MDLSSISLIIILQCVGVLFGILQVWYSKENRPINYLFGIVSVICNMYVLFYSKLYAETLLNFYYLLMSLYGWWFWIWGNKNTREETPITYSNSKDYLISTAIVFVAFCLFYFGLYHITDSDVPVWDASVAAFAWAGMWLLAQRKIENWIALNISNALAIPLMMHKGLNVFAVFYLFLFCMAVWGYFNWRKLHKKQISERL
ncbi:MAG: nicotinamide riboside transporter PnuC [Chitinophagales bacterium]|nr:nicotinamide riboside transporter PnuC [Chitinophagales bacterium]